jgi:hypothetical protein
MMYADYQLWDLLEEEGPRDYSNYGSPWVEDVKNQSWEVFREIK